MIFYSFLYKHGQRMLSVDPGIFLLMADVWLYLDGSN
jgi:hypothetical protein